MLLSLVLSLLLVAIHSSLPFVGAENGDAVDIFNAEQDQDERDLMLFKNKETFSKCGFTSDENFRTWFIGPYLFTDSPVLFPRNDEELAHIVTTAKSRRCRVRVRGAGHSFDGIVMQKLDQDVIIVHLNDYIPDDDAWNEVIDPDTPSIKISAGASSLRLISAIRPKGYLCISNTAGRIFSVGGVYMNPSTHGASFGNSTRLSSHVLSVRVMDANGNITEYSGDDVKTFRGSMGLLGIVTAMEIKIRKDKGLRMWRSSLSTKKFNYDEVKAYNEKKLSDSDACEWFWFPWLDILDTYSFTFDGNPGYDYESTAKWYKNRLNKKSADRLSFTGGGSSIPNIILTGIGVFNTFNNFIGKIVAKITSNSGRVLSITAYDKLAKTPNDAFIGVGDPGVNFKLLSWNAKCATDCADEMTALLETTRNYMRTIMDDVISDWYPTMMLEWRIFHVGEDDMLLEHLEPGKYVAFENFDISAPNDEHYAKYHKEMEEIWRAVAPEGGIHHGKIYAWGTFDGTVNNVPFQDDALVDSIYTQEVRDAFIEKMDLHDPSGVFRAGSVVRMLGLTDIKWTPQNYNGETCESRGNKQCMSRCCDKKLGSDVCIRSDKAKGEKCQKDCECAVDTSGNPCRLSFSSFYRTCRD